jgi:UDP-N-acetylglucosamine--N-acetylmuramyl-(pentapeptide) pyrophosphoryl-undecaprenol N-acetylglucosamine transferase
VVDESSGQDFEKAVQQLKGRCIAVSGGGTGGHIYPALAVAAICEQAGASIHWLGTQRGLESKLVPQAGYDLRLIDIQGIKGKGALGALVAPFRIMKAISQSIKHLRDTKPAVLLVTGGYVSGPVAIAAWLLRIPIVVHESNCVAGFTNKAIFPFAKRMLIGLLGAFDLKQSKVHWVGNPVRSDMLPKEWPSSEVPLDKLRLLVFGGSQGARVFNEQLPEMLTTLAKQLAKRHIQLSVTHQTGQAEHADTQSRYQALSTHSDLEYSVTPFLNPMSESYQTHDLVICRSGAMSVAELACVGMPSILVPLPTAIYDHQRLNAETLTKAGAGVLIPQSELNFERLSAIIEEGFTIYAALREKSANALKMAKPNASKEVVIHMLEVMKS